MARQYIIENRAAEGRWLFKVDKQDRRNAWESQVNHYGPHVEDAIVFKRKDEAVRFAERWGGRVWQIRQGIPVEKVWPE